MNALLFVADVERNEYIQAQQEHEVMCNILRKATPAPNQDVKRMLQIIIDVSGYQVTNFETRAICPNSHSFFDD
jgi:hypothetical protein